MTINKATRSETHTVRNVWRSLFCEIRSVAKATKIYANAKVEELKLKAKLGSLGFFISSALVIGGVSYLLAGGLVLFSLELPDKATKTIALGITIFGGLLSVAGIVALVGIRRWVKNLHNLESKEERALSLSKNLISKIGDESKLLLSPKFWFKNHPLAIISSGLAIGLLTRKPLTKGAANSFKNGEKYLFDLATTAITAAFVNQIKKELTSSKEEVSDSRRVLH